MICCKMQDSACVIIKRTVLESFALLNERQNFNRIFLIKDKRDMGGKKRGNVLPKFT